MSRAVATKSVGVTLRPLTAQNKRRVRERYHGSKRLDPEARRELAEAIATVEFELEDRRPKHPQVAIMRAVRNVLYDDVGDNEPWEHQRYPHIEAVEAVIREKRRQGRSAEHMKRIRPQQAAAGAAA